MAFSKTAKYATIGVVVLLIFLYVRSVMTPLERMAEMGVVAAATGGSHSSAPSGTPASNSAARSGMC
jgi:hypothetical protein